MEYDKVKEVHTEMIEMIIYHVIIEFTGVHLRVVKVTLDKAVI